MNESEPDTYAKRSPSRFTPDGAFSLWCPPFNFALGTPVTYKLFPRDAWRFVCYTLDSGFFYRVRLEFPEGGGVWFGKKVSITTDANPVDVSELSRLWPITSGWNWPIKRPPFELQSGANELHLDSIQLRSEIFTLVEWCFQAARPFAFYRSESTLHIRIINP